MHHPSNRDDNKLIVMGKDRSIALRNLPIFFFLLVLHWLVYIVPIDITIANAKKLGWATSLSTLKEEASLCQRLFSYTDCGCVYLPATCFPCTAFSLFAIWFANSREKKKKPQQRSKAPLQLVRAPWQIFGILSGHSARALCERLSLFFGCLLLFSCFNFASLRFITYRLWCYSKKEDHFFSKSIETFSVFPVFFSDGDHRTKRYTIFRWPSLLLFNRHVLPTSMRFDRQRKKSLSPHPVTSCYSRPVYNL